MRGQSFRVLGLAIAVLMGLVFAVVPAFAQSGTGGGQGVWYTLAPGQSQEWIFQYTGNKDRAVVELASNGAHNGQDVLFKVYTDQQWRSLASDSTVTPIGAGTVGKKTDTNGTVTYQNNGDLLWETGSTEGQTFHIQVYSTVNQPVQYWISATGAGIGFFGPAQGVQLVTAFPGNQTSNQQQMAQVQPAQGTTQGRAPRTLPVTGASDLSVLFAAGLALIASGWVLSRKPAR